MGDGTVIVPEEPFKMRRVKKHWVFDTLAPAVETLRLSGHLLGHFGSVAKIFAKHRKLEVLVGTPSRQIPATDVGKPLSSCGSHDRL